MSRENIDRFASLLMEDTGCQAKAKSLGGDPEALAVYARELGFEVSPRELADYMEKGRRLMEDRMEKIRGQKAGLAPGTQAFYDLIELAETDIEVAKRLDALMEGTREDLIAYGREKGFIFDEQDLDDVGRDILKPSDELSEEELELVAGGTTLLWIGLGLLAGGIIIAGTVGFLAGFVACTVLSKSGGFH